MAIPIYNPTSGVSQTITEFTDQSSVSISHNFSYKPRVIILDSGGNVIMGDIQYTNNSVSITFVIAISGTVYLT